MALRDTLTKRYMREPHHFADFFNGCIYGGEEVVKEDELLEVDTSNIAVIPYDKNNKSISVQKYRDIIKKSILMESDRAYYLFLGIENQTDIHYAMPVRNMLYDAMVYNQQVDAISKRNKEDKAYEGSGEFLSGLKKEDKLMPVITVTLYWGSEKWDGPTKLKDMLIKIDEKSDGYVNDYDCNLFSIIDADYLPVYKTELNELFQLLRTRNDGVALHDLVTNNDTYKRVDRDTAVLMREFANIKLPRKDKEGRYNLCKAVLELEKMNQEIGKEIGKEIGEKTGKEIGEKLGRENTWVEAIKNIMKTSKKTFEEACMMLCINQDDMTKYRKMI